jgi:hypothetical protein
MGSTDFACVCLCVKKCATIHTTRTLELFFPGGGGGVERQTVFNGMGPVHRMRSFIIGGETLKLDTGAINPVKPQW